MVATVPRHNCDTVLSLLQLLPCRCLMLYARLPCPCAAAACSKWCCARCWLLETSLTMALATGAPLASGEAGGPLDVAHARLPCARAVCGAHALVEVLLQVLWGNKGMRNYPGVCAGLRDAATTVAAAVAQKANIWTLHAASYTSSSMSHFLDFASCL